MGVLFSFLIGNPWPEWSAKSSKILLQIPVVGLGFDTLSAGWRLLGGAICNRQTKSGGNLIFDRGGVEQGSTENRRSPSAYSGGNPLADSQQPDADSIVVGRYRLSQEVRKVSPRQAGVIRDFLHA
jgi:hypothetical protein